VIFSSQGLYLNTGQHKHRINTYTHQTSMPCVGFEPTIPASEREKTVHGLDRQAAVTCINNIFCLWRYSPNLGLGLPPWNSPFHSSFLDRRQSVGPLGWVISSSQDLYLYINTEKRTHTHTKHPYPEWDSNPRSRHPTSEDSACLIPPGCCDRHQ
jgi:hypothetical protein